MNRDDRARLVEALRVALGITECGADGEPVKRAYCAEKAEAMRALLRELGEDA